MRLWIVPGPEIVGFLLHGGEDSFVLETAPAARFLDVLLVFAHAGRFAGADVAVPDPAELLPWTGNV